VLGKIIITGPFLENGGVAQFVKSLTPLFGQRVIVFQRGKRNAENRFGFIFPFIDIFRFLLFIKKIKPEKVVINSSLANVGIFRDGFFIHISKAFGIKTILYIHGFEEKALSKKSLIKFGYFKADKIFVLSSIFKNMLIQLGYSKSISVSYNPISEDLIDTPTDIIKELKKNDSIKILMMSRIEKSKGIFIGLEAIKALQSYKVELHIAGTGPDLEKAKEYVKEYRLQKVYFHGFITGKKKKELLGRSHILLFPTFHNEGLPINILESLAMGLYVITRPVAGIIDLSKSYHLLLNDSLASVDFKNNIVNLLETGLPEAEIKENQNKAKVDFSPKTIFDKVVLSS